MLFINAIEDFENELRLIERSESTINKYINSSKQFNRYLEQKFNCPVYVNDITREDIKEYLAKMREKSWATSTRNHFVFILRSFFNFAIEEGIVDANPADDIKQLKTSRKERTYLSKDEVVELSNAIEHHIVSIAVKTAYYSGLRPSELMDLKLSELDLKRKLIRVKEGKGNKDRTVPICDELEALLKDYLANIRPEVDSEYLFATETSGRLSTQYYNRRIKEAVRDLAWEKDVTAHVLRHSFATRLVEQDVNLEKIRRLLGHSSLQTTAIYCHTSTKTLSQAVNKL